MSAHRAIAPGMRAAMLFQILLASENSPSPSRIRVPLNLPRSESQKSVSVIMIFSAASKPREQTVSLPDGEVDVLFQHFQYRTNIVQRVVQMKGYPQSVHPI